jgi:glycosyltransferase involved in cell wall biosynthesis
MEKTKILFISRAYPPTVGGIENQNYELGRWLGKIAEVKIIANTRGKKFLPVFLPYAILKTLLVLPGYDVVLLGDGVLGILGWIVKLLSKKPVICVVHGLDLTFPSKIYRKFWVGSFIPELDALIAVGNETIRVGVQHGIGEKKFFFIPNGVDTEKHLVKSSREDLTKIIGQPAENKKILLTSGRLAKRKGVAWFIADVLPKLSQDFLYVVAGDGRDKQNILDAIKKNGLEKRVVMLGYVSDEKRNILFNTADLFVQPNIKVPGDMEGFGISVIEAGACSLPVLAADIEGLKDAIKEGRNGFLVESENADAFVQKINELFSKGNPREIYGQAVRTYVVENYSWEHVSEIYLEEIKKTINFKL